MRAAGERSHLHTIRTLLPYLWPRGALEMRGRVVLAVLLLVGAKVANVYVPLLYKDAVDILADNTAAVIVVPVAILLAYGALRVLTVAFGELRDAVFAKVGERAIRTVALRVFSHLHTLSLRFHIERRTGGLSRAIERGIKGIEFLLTFMLFNILPTLVEVTMVCGILWFLYGITYAAVTFVTIGVYIAFNPLGHRMAAEVSPAHEREGQRGQHQGHRQPAQLRDGEVFRQRGARGAALRCLAPALRAGGGAEQDQPLAAEHRPGNHRRHRAHRHHHHGRQRGRRRHHDHRRLRTGQHVSSATVHPAQLPRLRLPRDQAVAHRHGGDVRHPLGQPRGRGRSRRRALERDRRRHRVRRRALSLRGAARHPRRHLVQRGAGHHHRHRGPERRRQVDHFAHPLPLLRHRVRLGQDRRPGTCATCVRTACARPSGSFPRTRCSSTTPSTTTSPTAGRRRAGRRWRRRRGSPAIHDFIASLPGRL